MKKYTIVLNDEQLDTVRKAINTLSSMMLGQTALEHEAAKELSKRLKTLHEGLTSDLTN